MAVLVVDGGGGSGGGGSGAPELTRGQQAWAARYSGLAQYYGAAPARQPAAVQEAQRVASTRGWQATGQRYQAQAAAYLPPAAPAPAAPKESATSAPAAPAAPASTPYATMEAPPLQVTPSIPEATIRVTYADLSPQERWAAQKVAPRGASPELVLEGGPGWGAAYVDIPFGPGEGYQPAAQLSPTPGGVQLRLPISPITAQDVTTFLSQVDWSGVVRLFTPSPPTASTPEAPELPGSPGVPVSVEPPGLSLRDWLLGLLFGRPQAQGEGEAQPAVLVTSAGSGGGLAQLWQESPVFRLGVVGLTALLLWRVLFR